ncbi:MAG: formimidoylglutamate deiminase [Gemmatimonadetes bacterium]|nr:formimidoylglutamate deiminase [Gemmatimonadota bacterium]
MPPRARPRHRFRFERLLIGDRWQRDAVVAVDERGRILSVEPGSNGGCETVAGWTVPGVPNVHSHSFQRALAGLAEGGGPDSFWSWREAMYAFLRHLTPDDVEAVTAQLYVEMLKAGFTCVGEFHYLHRRPDGGAYDDPAEMSRRVIAAARATGIGLVHMPVVYETGGFGGEALAGSQRRFRMDLEGAARLHAALGGEGSRHVESARPGPSASPVQLGWAVHSLRAVSRESFARFGDFVSGGAGPAAAGEAPVHIHVAEQEKEVRDCLADRKARPVEWLLDHAPVDERWCLVHGTHVSDAEVAGVVRRGAVAGLCPTTEANLGDGLFPLGAFAALGGRFAIGTDSHVSRSPVEELRLLDYGQRLVCRTRSVLKARKRASGTGGGRVAETSTGANGPGDGVLAEAGGALAGAGGTLLQHAWDGGCRALAWDGGRVEVGARADLVVLDAEHPALAGRGGRAVLDSWLFSGTDNPVRDVMVGGNWVVQSGRHAREEEVGRAFTAAVKGLGART